MTSVPTNSPFKFATSSAYPDGFPAAPGAYLINSGIGAIPIFCSITDLGTIGANDIDNWYLLMPYYSLKLYKNTGYSSTQTSISSSTAIQYCASPNKDGTSSLQLFYNGLEVKIQYLS